MLNCTEILVDDTEAFEDEFEMDDAKLYVSIKFYLLSCNLGRGWLRLEKLLNQPNLVRKS